MQYGQYSLRGKKTVGNQTNDKRGNDGAQRLGSVRYPHLYIGDAGNGFQVCTHGHEPGSPDKEVKKHHNAKPEARGECHEQGIDVKN